MLNELTMLARARTGATSRHESLLGGEPLWVEHMSPFTSVSATLALLLGVGLVGGAVGGFAANGDIAALFVALMFAVLVRFSVSGLLRPRLEARSTGVYVRNIVREYWVPWSAITSVGGDMNVTITTASGTILTVWAIQKTNLASMLNHRSRVDRVAERLSKARAAQRAPADAPGPVQSRAGACLRDDTPGVV